MSDDHDMRSGRGRPAKKLKRVDQHDGTESGQEADDPMAVKLEMVDQDVHTEMKANSTVDGVTTLERGTAVDRAQQFFKDELAAEMAQEQCKRLTAEINRTKKKTLQFTKARASGKKILDHVTQEVDDPVQFNERLDMNERNKQLTMDRLHELMEEHMETEAAFQRAIGGDHGGQSNGNGGTSSDAFQYGVGNDAYDPDDEGLFVKKERSVPRAALR